MSEPFSRRHLLTGGAGLAGLSLAGCDRLNRNRGVQSLLGQTEKLTLASQRLLMPHRPLAREYSAKDISPVFKANGSFRGYGEEYDRMVETGFADWRLRIDGLVERPLAWSLAALKKLPARTQITRHDCVEGWSAIGGWTGVPLATLLLATGLKPEARFLVFHCADNLGGHAGGATSMYYESIDLIDAFHPQTILAYALNGAALPVRHGAPIRLRVERALGYKQAKYVMRIEAVESFAHIGGGKGGFWEDRGYEWYAGI
ncbi:MAG: molybdopterin-dependent oxidoreductase [Caulobacteraceae bacterium]